MTWILLSEIMTATSITMRTPVHLPIPDFISRTDETNPLNNINAGSHSLPVFVDFDDDNDPMTSSSGTALALSTILRTPELRLIRVSFNVPTLITLSYGANAGGFSALEFADLNGDGNLDLIIGNQVGEIHYFKNTGTDASPEFSPQKPN